MNIFLLIRKCGPENRVEKLEVDLSGVIFGSSSLCKRVPFRSVILFCTLQVYASSLGKIKCRFKLNYIIRFVLTENIRKLCRNLRVGEELPMISSKWNVF